MSPWNVLGWLLVSTIAAFALLFIVAVIVAFAKDYRAARRRRRAEEGKVRCEQEGCNAIAERRTPKGYFCDDHWRANRGGGAVSFAFLLKHAQKSRPSI